MRLPPEVPANRRQFSSTEALSIVMLVLQLAALIWGASALKSSVDELRTSATNLGVNVRDIQNTVNGLTVDVGVLKDRVLTAPRPVR